MKKFFLFFFVVVLTTTSFAQLRYGVKLGLNFASFSGSDASDAKSVTKYQLGGFAKYSLPALFSFQAEALYSMKGAQTKLQDPQGNNWTVSYNVDYLEIPLLVQVNFPLAIPTPIVPYIEAGPTLGLTLSGKTKAETQGFSVENDIKSDLTGSDLGLALGVGVNVFKTFGANIRYTFGFSTIDNTANPDDIKNSVVSLTFNYNF